jgi:hypothetical protein
MASLTKKWKELTIMMMSRHLCALRVSHCSIQITKLQHTQTLKIVNSKFLLLSVSFLFLANFIFLCDLLISFFCLCLCRDCCRRHDMRERHGCGIWGMYMRHTRHMRFMKVFGGWRCLKPKMMMMTMIKWRKNLIQLFHEGEFGVKVNWCNKCGGLDHLGFGVN